ncbi:ABC transporter substrate-binding protein, partial [Pseudomonadota bacterium]
LKKVNTAKTLNKIGRKLFFVGYIIILTMLGIQLFFGDQIAFLINSLESENVHEGSEESIVIGYAFAPSRLDPVEYNPTTRSHIVDIYEGLVSTDRNLKTVPALAVSWGLKDSNTWEFRLRPNIYFHNGDEVTVEDVLSSIDNAMTDTDSQLKNLLGTIDEVKAVGEDRVQVVTKVPDPLLLSKLAVTYITPEDHFDLSTPIGTGPYRFVSRDDNELKLEAFHNYWGGPSYYHDATLRTIPNRRDRIKALEEGTIDLLVNVPPNVACSVTENYDDLEGCTDLKTEGLEIKSIPSLEVSFLIFNFDNELFKDKKIRESLKKALDPQTFVDLAFGFARPVGQYVSSGVFGFNPEIEASTYDIESAEEIKKQFEGSFERIAVTLDFPMGTEAVAYYVQQQFKEFGIDTDLNPLEGIDFLEKIESGESDLYFLGWRSELGDSGDFLEAIAHTRQTRNQKGLLNGANYSNDEVDKLIEDSQQELDTEKRLQALQEAMRLITEEDILGIPLFESETIYAFKDSVHFEPRVDGYVFVSQLHHQ